MVRLFVVMYPSETFHSLNTSSGVYFSWTHISAYTSPGACSSVLPGPFRIVLSRTSTSKQQQCKWDLHLVSRSQSFFKPHRSPNPNTVTRFAVPEPANWSQNSDVGSICNNYIVFLFFSTKWSFRCQKSPPSTGHSIAFMPHVWVVSSYVRTRAHKRTRMF